MYSGGAAAISTYFYKDKSVFGFDLGHGSFKIMQVDRSGKQPSVLGYGTASFDSSATDDGIIVKPEIIAKATKEMFERNFNGILTTRRAAIAIPSYRSFSRSMQLPKLDGKELAEAVRLEVEQYIPMPLKDLYLDYTITEQNANEVNLLAVAVPKKLVDSYMVLAEVMGMEPVLIETTMAAAARLFGEDKNSNLTSVIIDFGSLTADIGIFDKSVLVAGTVPAGGLVFTNLIREKLKVSEAEAGFIKTKYGLGVSKKQAEITEALTPALQKIVTEIRRMSRYYEERYGSGSKIDQVIILGGGANMPGLGDYLTSALRIPVRSHDPWNHLQYKGLRVPSDADKLMYATVAGLSLLDPKAVFEGVSAS